MGLSVAARVGLPPCVTVGQLIPGQLWKPSAELAAQTDLGLEQWSSERPEECSPFPLPHPQKSCIPLVAHYSLLGQWEGALCFEGAGCPVFHQTKKNCLRVRVCILAGKYWDKTKATMTPAERPWENVKI